MKSSQLTAWCAICGGYIKNIPYAEPSLHFGKYARTKIVNISDAPYLEWLLENHEDLKKNIREAIKVQIDKLNNK